MNDAARRQLDEATQTRYAISSLSLKVLEAVRNGRPLTLNDSEKITMAWVIGAGESLALERERQAREWAAPIKSREEVEADAREAVNDLLRAKSAKAKKKASK